MNKTADDYRYIVRLIHFLQRSFMIRFFITVSDFDTLYHWWEKHIPAQLVEEAMTKVVLRWQEKGRVVTSFRQFAGEVRKMHRALNDLQIGQHGPTPTLEMPAPQWFVNFPAELDAARQELEHLYQRHVAGETVDPAPLFAVLLDFYRNDAELAAKTQLFLNNLAPTLRRPEVERQYRLNYLIHNLRIPDFF